MSHLSRTWLRPLLFVVALALVGLASARDEEEEVTPKKPTKKIVVEDDAVPPGTAGTTIADLVRAAAGDDHATIKKYFATCAVPHDRLTVKGGRQVRVSIVPLLYPADKATFPDPFGAAELDVQNQPAAETLGIAVARIIGFERLLSITG